jgi:hypothetical protein
MMVVLLPQEKMAAKNPAISMSCFLVNEWGMQIGSDAINKGWLYSFTFLLRNILSCVLMVMGLVLCSL